MSTHQRVRKLVRGSSAAVVFVAMVATFLAYVPAAAEAVCTGNAIVCENQLDGSPASEWDTDGRGDDSIQGFATQISVNAGSPIQFKIDTDARAYTVNIYRLGFYKGAGARKVATVTPSAPLPQKQPDCVTSTATQIFDCGTWGVSATWNVPATAVSGVYIANLVRTDTQKNSHIPFVVRKDGNTSQALFQTSDPTWQAYNTYGGSNFYYGGPNGRSFKASYNRPFSTRDIGNGRDFLFANEYPMIRFLEENGVDVSYVSGQDTSVDPNLITRHKMFMSVGHDEYWSAEQRANVTAARDAGVNLAFFGGNDVYWKTAWQPSQDGTNTPNRTLVCYKDTWANNQNGAATPIDPKEPLTPTWRDPRFGDLGFGPENSLMGTQYQSNSTDLALKINAAEGKLRLWRNTDLAVLPDGGSARLAAHTVGYESDEDVDNGFRPAGLIRLSTTTGPSPEYLTDFGNTVVPGTTTHHLTLYRAASKALVFGAGTVQWAWGLDSHHDGLDVQPADPRMRQATVNLLADMSVDATTPAIDLAPATKSVDETAPSSTISQPTANSTLGAGDQVTVSGTAADIGGIVAGVEVSVDGGATFHPAEGTTSYSYTGVQTGTGPGAIQVRAIDDSGNIQSSPTMLAVTANCPCSIFGALTPVTPAVDDTGAMTLGTRFTAQADGFITGIRFYKGPGNTGTHTGTLYGPNNAALGTATFTNETTSGWQNVNFASAVPVVAGQVYTAAYHAPNGRYAGDRLFFSYRPYTSGALTALGGKDVPNGVFAYGNQFPGDAARQTNYYVDAVWSATDTTPLAVTSVDPPGDASSVPSTTTIAATFSRAAKPSSVGFSVTDPSNAAITGSISADGTGKVFTFTPDQPLATNTRYRVLVSGQTTAGAGMPAPYQWFFTTAKAPAVPGACPCSVFDDGDGPSTAPDNETSTVQLGMAFTSADAGVISGIRFYKASANAGPHTVALWDNNGNQVATAPVTGETTAGWQQADFASPYPISANTTYIASYVAPKGRYSATSGGLTNKITKGPLSTVATGGRYVYSATSAPTSKSAANYWVDAVFSPAPGAPPTVQSTTPGNGARSVPVSVQVTANFSTNVQPSTATVTLKRTSDGAEVPGHAPSEVQSSAVTFVPAGDLDAGTTYTLTVSGATNAAGVAMTAPYSMSFTTSGAAACPCSLLETTTVPAMTDAGDSSATTLGLKFTPTVNGFVKGIRYYRDSSNTGTHTGSLWTAAGDRKAVVTFADSGPGWQTATFSSPVPVTADTTYVVGYYAPNGHYAASLGYFSSPVLNVPLASSGSGGVYANGDNFPDQTYQNTNYYVDAVFTTTDDDPPTVGSVSPEPGATAVAGDSPATATFNRDIEPSSLSMTLTGPGGQLVGGQFGYDPPTRKATYTAAGPLAGNTVYTVSVSANSASGVSMPSPRTWSFTTAATALVVVGTSPMDTAFDVPAGSSVTARFSTDIATGSSDLTVKNPAGTAVAGTKSYDPTTRTVSFKPTSALANYTVYTATASATNAAGVAMATPKTWSFTTADTVAPTVSAVVPTAGRTGVATASTVSATFARQINPASAQFSVKDPAGVVVAGSLGYLPSTRVATFTPTTPLASLTTYSVSLTANNPSGVPMAAPRTWSFTTRDDDPPVVSGVAPEANTTGVAAATRPTATFARAITAGSLAFTVRDAAGATVAGRATYNTTTWVATFVPTAALTSSTTYTASIQASSATGVAMAAPKTWSFRTAAQVFSLYATTRTPTTTASATAPTTVGVVFSSARGGQVTAIRYYANAANTATTVKLRSSSGDVLGTATTTQTGTGWRTATFATPIEVSAGTSYVASVHAPTGRISSTASGYTSAYTAGPLTVPASGGRTVAGDANPTTTSTTNFWVDVLVSI